MTKNKNTIEAIERRKGFYYDNLEAKRFVDDLLNKGISTPEALNQMRWKFAKEYFEWKKKKGFKFMTYTDKEALKLKGDNKCKEKQDN